ncbi:MAG: M15 family metallopeptidase, partial [Oscillospiraceae bacterium]|nr:M15 family metallopeptidase [Oscillospiraceae bacterium]
VIAKAIGFSWGGDWTSFRDCPHLQWDDRGRYTTAMLRAGKAAPAMPKYEEEDMAEKRYQTREEIARALPWAAATLQKCIDKGILRGNVTGLDLSEDMIRMLVYMDRAGIYSGKDEQ